MTTYDPFSRGTHPVGVRTEYWLDEPRGRDIPVEIYYPSVDSIAGRDIDPETQDTFSSDWDPDNPARQAAVRDAPLLDGRFPVVFNVHGWAGFRREATFVATHLASHGYLVVAPDILGSTAPEVDEFFASQAGVGDETALAAHMDSIADNRRGDVPFLVQHALDTLPVADEQIGITGASYGGWTSLIGPVVAPRIKAAVPMCPGGGSTFREGRKRATTKLNKIGPIDHGVPTLMLVGSRDSMLPLFGQFELYRDLVPDTRRMVVLLDADHNHFVDNIETGHEWMRAFLDRCAETYPGTDWEVVARVCRPFDELAPEGPTEELWRGLTTAHFDAVLKSDARASALLEDRRLDRVLEDATGLATVTVRD
ncbi:alpha/beta hydrolase family protein [Amnibacterium flavum]|uniref:Dienelactone hydrolase domain-containing protein n=1 Tax=Amnibacterium flavum TaxID=2173173 RepID=A0A2V1HS02_9MICO|nr:dienelactone hydrolase family protein [Amnibacterium flavum]PVZ95373.1 hypothetical protein DDQ50_02310 [Amnibacterium flavum]